MSHQAEARIIRSSGAPEKPPPDRIRDAVIAQALREQADAILLQSTGAGLRVMYRIAGCWNATMTIPSHLQQTLTTSFRQAAGLSVQSTAQPTPYASHFDIGLILFEHEGSEYDIYISFLPTREGEKIALRLLPKSDPPVAFMPLELLQL